MKRLYVPIVLLGLAFAAPLFAQKSPAPDNNPPTAQTAPAQPPDANLPPSGVLDSNDPLLQPPPLPPGKPSLVGGVVGKVDRVRQVVVVKPYGGTNMKIYFDERTHIFRNGVETTMLGIHKGDRIYADTLLDGTRVLAKNLRVVTEVPPAHARGTLVSYDPGAGRVELRDELSAQEVTFRVGHDTVVRQGDQVGSLANLRPGSLVTVSFAPISPGADIAREITIVAAPGSLFHFNGTITYLDMSQGLLALHNRNNDQSYEIHFDPHNSAYRTVGLGSEVQLSAVFDGVIYTAREISLAASETPQDGKQ